MKKVMFIFGTRPEAIKLSPVIIEFNIRDKFEVITCITGQHKEMLDSVLDFFQLKPKYNLKVMRDNQTLNSIAVKVIKDLELILNIENPDLIFVHGDTNTTFASALASFYKNIPVAHVEAGLRSHNIHSPYPEEFNRKAVSIIANYNFAPTKQARNNLLNEGCLSENIYVTGNTVVDVLKYTIKDDFQHPLLNWIGDNKLILITTHRRENIGIPMENMFKAINRFLNQQDNFKVIFPVHPNPRVSKIAEKFFLDNSKVKLIPPLDVIEFHNFLSRSYIILTDSGGIQEEAASLSIPTLVMRDTTERPEGIEMGNLKLVGTNEESIYSNLSQLAGNQKLYFEMSRKSNPFGDGTASHQIAQIIEDKLYN